MSTKPITERMKREARAMVNRAVRRGLIQRPRSCTMCGGSMLPVQAHHANYRRPLDIDWLCTSCHAEVHAGLDVSELHPYDVLRLSIEYADAAREAEHFGRRLYEYAEKRLQERRELWYPADYRAYIAELEHQGRTDDAAVLWDECE